MYDFQGSYKFLGKTRGLQQELFKTEVDHEKWNIDTWWYLYDEWEPFLKLEVLIFPFFEDEQPNC